MLRKFVGVVGVLGFLLLGACSSDSNFGGGGASLQQINLVDSNGAPISGATVWVPVNNPLATLTDSQGNTCGDPLSDYLQAACSDSTGKVVLQCSPGQSLSVLVAQNEIEIGAFTLTCTGSPITQTLESLLSEIFVANNGNNSIGVFDIDDEGDIAPLREIVGPSTGLSGPAGIVVFNDEIYVGNYVGGNVTVYPIDADGDVAPTRVITSLQPFANIDSLAIFDNQLYVANQLHRVFIMDVASNGLILTEELTGAATGFIAPSGMLVIGDELIVVDASSNSISTFNVTDRGDTAPIRVIQGPNTLLNNTYNPHLIGDEIVVASCDNNFILFFPPSASGDVAPSRSITGASTQLSCPTSAVPMGTQIGVANYNGNSISFYPTAADGNVAPLRVIVGASTNLLNPWGMVAR